MGFNRDALHAERKKLESDLRSSGMFSKDQMDQRDCQDEDHEVKRVNNFVRWKETKDSKGRTNTQKQNRWHEINRKFKEQGIEGAKLHTTDQLREKKRISYE